MTSKYHTEVIVVLSSTNTTKSTFLKFLSCFAFLSLSFSPPLQKHVKKVDSGFGKKSCVSTGVRKPGNTLCVIDCHDMTLVVKVALNPNTTNQPTLFLSLKSIQLTLSRDQQPTLLDVLNLFPA